MKYTYYKPLEPMKTLDDSELPSTPRSFGEQKLSQQSGSALVMAIMVLVVLGFLAISLMRFLADSQRSVTYEVYGARALMVAQSGIELGLVTLFPLGAGGGIGSCSGFPITDQWQNSGLNGLPNCSATISCSFAQAPPPESQIYYQLTSTAVCAVGSGLETTQVARTINVEARGFVL